MRHASIVLGTTIVLALAGVSQAQRPRWCHARDDRHGAAGGGRSPRRAGTLQSRGWTGFRLAGPCGLSPGRPGSVPGRKTTLPLMVWGNGGCAINSTRYGGFLTTIASHGFVVMATAAEPGAAPGRSSADNLRKAIDWADV